MQKYQIGIDLLTKLWKIKDQLLRWDTILMYFGDLTFVGDDVFPIGKSKRKFHQAGGQEPITLLHHVNQSLTKFPDPTICLASFYHWLSIFSLGLPLGKRCFFKMHLFKV